MNPKVLTEDKKNTTKKTWSKRGQNGSKAPALTPEELEFMGIPENSDTLSPIIIDYVTTISTIFE